MYGSSRNKLWLQYRINIKQHYPRDTDPFNPLKIGTLRYHDGDVKKAIGWIAKTPNLHVHQAFLYISLPLLHDYDVKIPNFTSYGGCKQATTKFSFSFWTWLWFLGIRFKESSLAFDKVNVLVRSNLKREILKFWKFERTQIHFLSDVFVAVVVVVS